jgi:hypothetical protein
LIDRVVEAILNAAIPNRKALFVPISTAAPETRLYDKSKTYWTDLYIPHQSAVLVGIEAPL